MTRPRLKVCSVPGCPTLSTASRCETHTRQADRARGNTAQRGYSTAGHRRFREAVLTRDPLCVCDLDCPHHIGAGECLTLSTVADHWPLSRRDLVAMGDNPNDPSRGRGVCERCHNAATARAQPGGWNQH